MTYTFNTREIKRKRRDLIAQLKTTTDSQKRNDIITSLRNLFNLLTLSGNIFTLPIYKFANRKYRNHSNEKIDKIDEARLKHLIEIAEICSCGDVKDSSRDLDRKDISVEESIKLAREFYEYLGDSEYCEYVDKILNPNNNLLFMKNKLTFDERLNQWVSTTLNPFKMYLSPGRHGWATHDFINRDSYCMVDEKDTFHCAKTLIHEIMHAIEFQINDKINASIHRNCFGYKEIPSFFIETIIKEWIYSTKYYFRFGEDIELLLNKRKRWIQEDSHDIVHKFFREVSDKRFAEKRNDVTCGDIPSVTYDIKDFYESGDILAIMDENLFEHMEYVSSYVISQAMANIYKQDKKAGLKLLREIMNTTSPTEIYNVLSEYGIIEDTLVETSEQIYTEYCGYQKIR